MKTDSALMPTKSNTTIKNKRRKKKTSLVIFLNKQVRKGFAKVFLTPQNLL